MDYLYYSKFTSRLCDIFLAGDDAGLKHLVMDTEQSGGRFSPPLSWKRNDDFFTDAIHQLREYLEGGRREFSLPLAPQGTVFQKKVWEQLQNIPYGETRTYGQIAAASGNPAAARAVGAANRNNPLAIIIPCHRVIGTDGKLTGYAYGNGIKKQLLELEKNNKA